MEIHKELVGSEVFRPNTSDPYEYFKDALKFTKHFYGDTVEQIASVKLENIQPEFFFKEYIWVVHATGFSAKAVGKFMPRLMEAYGTYESLSSKEFDAAFENIKMICNNPQKSKAVWKTSVMMSEFLTTKTWDEFRNEHLSDTQKLSILPYIGKVTCFHLGRNIGLLDCVKPDLHLVRMAEHWGFKDCIEMCELMRNNVDPTIPLGIVDLALWYSASTFGTLEIKKENSR